MSDSLQMRQPPKSEYQLLLEDLEAGINLRETKERLQKAQPVFLTSSPHSRVQPPTGAQLLKKAEALNASIKPIVFRRREHPAECLNGIMAKAMDLFEQGKLTALEVIKLDTRVKRLQVQHQIGAWVLR